MSEKKCNNCGEKLRINDSFCSSCGSKVEHKIVNNNFDNIKTNFLNNTNKIKSNVSKNVSEIKNNNKNKNKENKDANSLNKKKLIPTWAIVLFIFIGLYIIGIMDDNSNFEAPSSGQIEESQSNEKNDNDSSSNNSSNTNSNTNKNDDNNLKKLNNIKPSFKKVCKEINMDSSKVNSIKKIEDWSNGPRYTFSYEQHHFILYAYDNGNISSIRIGNGAGTQIYLEGYEPYNVKDFMVDISELPTLQIKSEEAVKDAMNYPNTADFHWITTGGYGKYKNYYGISAEVDGKNAFGVKITSKFYVELEKNDNSYNVVYMTIDNKVYKGNNSKMILPERKEIDNESTEEKTDNSFIVKEGQKGTYGKEDLFDGKKYIRHHIPAGTYEVEALVKNSSFFIETKQIHKEDGYDTATTIRKVVLSKVGDKDIIEIKEDQCITMIMYSQIKFTKIS